VVTGAPAAAAARTFHGVDLARVEQAVRTAERRTRGEIRVALARFYFWGDVERAARRAFTHLGMHRTRERNAVLIFVSLRRRGFAILGDSGIHERAGQTFWQEVAAALQAALRAGDLDGGLVRAVGAVGERLAVHFPADAAEAKLNELPDSVALGGQGGGRGAKT
jgi:uncharacterized membrane protein